MPRGLVHARLFHKRFVQCFGDVLSIVSPNYFYFLPIDLERDVLLISTTGVSILQMLFPVLLLETAYQTFLRA